MQTTIATPARRSAGAKVVGSVAIVAAAAAVAGLGTFGAFTDSTQAMATGVDSGTVSIDLAQAAHHVVLPDVDGGWAAGDRTSIPIDLVNTGTSPLESVTLAVAATRSSVLDADRVLGLQMTIQNCSRSWDAGSGYSCGGAVTEYYSGPVVMKGTLDGAASLAPGGVDHLLVTVTLPESAGNEFQGRTSVLRSVFTGVQRDGTAR